MKNKKSGFTLMEILVTVALLGLVLAVVTNLFLTILRTSLKARALSEVKQNGDYALQVMERMLRNARSVVGDCQSGMSAITLKNPDGGQTTFTCEANQISSNSASLTSQQVRPVALSCFFDCSPGEAGASSDVVTVRFDLERVGSNLPIEEEASVGFQTSVALRNY